MHLTDPKHDARVIILNKYDECFTLSDDYKYRCT